MSAASLHAILSPSGADRWMQCPGSVKLSKGIPNKDNAYSTEGTDLHEVAALCLEEEREAKDLVGQAMLSDALLTEDQAEVVQKYVDVVRTYRDVMPGAVLRVEEKLSLTFLTNEEGAQGTADAIIISSEPELIVIDAKFGHGEVSVTANKQLMIYGIAALEKHELWETVTRVRLVIMQPRTSGTKEWVATIEEMTAFAAEVRTAANTVDRQPDLLVPGEKACKWCLAKASCPAITKLVDETTTLDGFSIEGEVKATETGPREDSPESLSLKMSRIPMIEEWIKSIRASVESCLLKGVAIPGWKLVKGKKGNREWTSESVVEAMLKEMKYKDAEMYKRQLITPAVAEKLVKKTSANWKRLTEHTTQKDGGLSVAPASDARPQVVLSSPEEGFEVEVSDDQAMGLADLL